MELLLDQPNVGNEDRNWCIVSGGDAYDLLSASGIPNHNSLPTLFRQMVTAVHFIHERGVFHRNLSAESFVTHSEGEDKDKRVFLTNFNQARIVRDGATTIHYDSRTPLGQPFHRAPETFDGEGDLDWK